MIRKIKFRFWDDFNRNIHKQKGTLASDLKRFFDNYNAHFEGGNDVELMQYTGVKDCNGTEIYEGDIIEYKYYYAHRRWWSNTGEIEEIRKEFQKQKDNYDVYREVVKFKEGEFKINFNLKILDVDRGERIDRGKTTSGEYERKAWDFKVIGNKFENPELLDN